MRILSPALCAVSAIALPAHAFALQLAQTAGTAEEIEQRARKQVVERTPGIEQPVQLAAELGTALSRGNTETFHLNTNVRLTWAFAERWVSETRARALYEESFGHKTASNWGVFERVDRFLSERIAAFVAAAVEQDVFAGIDSRYSGQLGASLLLLENRDEALDVMRDKLTVELGAYAARENFTLPPNAGPDVVLEEKNRDIYAARAALGYVHTFRKGTSAGVDVEAIEDFNDTENFVLNDSAYVAAAIVDGLALKFAVSHRFDNQPASEELQKNDVLVTAGIVVSL